MKTLLSAVFSLMPLFAGQLSITDTQGRKLQVEVLSMTEAKVTVSKVDGTRVDIPLFKISPASREAIAAEVKKIEAAKPRGITVTHLVTKIVEGKFRYFFRIQNNDPVPWTGSATITLLNTQPGVKNGQEKFVSAKPIEPCLGSVVFIDARTGPAAVHGDWSVAGFSYEINDGTGKLQSAGKGSLDLKTDGF